MKNIWILNHYAELGLGRHYKFAHNLTKRGYNVKLFAASTIHNSDKNRITDSKKYIVEEMEGVPCIYIKACNYEGNGKARIKNMFDYAIGLMSVSKKFDYDKPDVIYASSVHPLTWISGYLLSKRYKSKFIAETRDLWPETLVAMDIIGRNSIPAKILYKLEKFIYKKADKLIFTMEGGKQYIIDKGWDNYISLDKVNYINNGIDLSEFKNNLEEHRLEDEDLLDNSSFKIIYTGSIGKPNMVISILEVAKYLKGKEINDIKFIIYGDGLLRSSLMKYASDNKLANVKFKGKVDKKYIPFILNQGDMNIIVGKDIYLYKYGFSQNKFFGYLASGKPTISNRSCHEILDKQKCGITVEGGSAEALTEGILKFYNMPKEEYNQYCKNALKVAENFDFKVLTDKLEKVILED